MHVCEKLWSRFNGVDRKDITKIYGGGFLFDPPTYPGPSDRAAPADPFSTLRAYDAISRAPI